MLSHKTNTHKPYLAQYFFYPFLCLGFAASTSIKENKSYPCGRVSANRESAYRCTCHRRPQEIGLTWLLGRVCTNSTFQNFLLFMSHFTEQPNLAKRSLYPLIIRVSRDLRCHKVPIFQTYCIYGISQSELFLSKK